jgi:hypothetical protein
MMGEENQPIAQHQPFAFAQSHGLFRRQPEVFASKRSVGEQAVIADMPRRRVTAVFRVVKEGDGDRFAI